MNSYKTSFQSNRHYSLTVTSTAGMNLQTWPLPNKDGGVGALDKFSGAEH